MMKPLERIRRTIARQPADRLPVAPYLANWTARFAGVSLKDYCSDARRMAAAQLAAWEKVGQDVIFPDADNYYLAEGFGCQAALHEEEVPTLARPALRSCQEVFDLEVPDPHRDGRMPVYLEATRLIAAQLGEEAAIRVPGTGPFAVASTMIGVEEFLIEVSRIEQGEELGNAAAIERMLDLAAEALTRFGLAQMAAGEHILQCGDSLASASVISPETFRRFVLPRHQRIFAAWKQAGALTALHVCGRNARVLGLFAATGADIVAIDSLVDLRTAKGEIGGQVTLIGNIDPVGVMLKGTVAQVEAAARDCIAAAGAGGGYILGTGCEVPPHAPLENIQALVRMARRQEEQL
jgi:uroporphyrinogen decarboxylase